MAHARSRWRAAAIVMAVAVCVLATFVGLLVVAETIPDEAVASRLQTAVARGEYGPPQSPDGMGGVHTGYTDCVILGVGLGEPRTELGLVRRTLYAPRLGSCRAGAQQIRIVAAGGEVPSGPYYRYWNGHTILTRPVVATVGVVGLRVVVAGLAAVAAVVAIVALGRRAGWGTTAALFLPLLVGTNAVVTPVGSVAHAIALAAALAGVGAVVVATDRWGRVGAAASAALAAAVFVYVDQLTTPALPWAMAAFAAGAVERARRADVREVGLTVITVSVLWPVAYGVSWAARWVLAAVALEGEVMSDILEQGQFRVSGDHPRVEDRLGAAVDANWTWWIDHLVTARVLVVVAALVAVWALVVVVRRAGWRGVVPVAVLGAPAAIVPAWYELLSNHSQIHRHFTYRSLVMALAIGVAACVLVARTPEEHRSEGQPARSAV